LEVILALGLTVVVLSIISFATSTFWRAHRHGHAAVENAQLARALLARIANDLRATVVVLPEPASAAAGAETSDPFASATSDATLVDPMESAAAAEGAVSNAETPLGARPGIYGNAFALQLDVCRAMRSDEFLLASANPGGTALPLGVTTVSYFVTQNLGPAPVMPAGAVGGLSPGAAAPTGLVRRVVNRAVAGQAGLASLGALPQRVELLAPEVVGLQFRYFDGYQWFLAWDSELMEASPVAVEILLTLRAADARAPSPAALPATAALEQYRLVVHLPVSAPMQDATLSVDPLTTSGL
jgi:hypothetical protein